jgi:hypothetical protein
MIITTISMGKSIQVSTSTTVIMATIIPMRPTRSFWPVA